MQIGTWILDQLKNNFWELILLTVIVYFVGGFTMPLIPGLNNVVVAIASKGAAAKKNKQLVKGSEDNSSNQDRAQEQF